MTLLIPRTLFHNVRKNRFFLYASPVNSPDIFIRLCVIEKFHVSFLYKSPFTAIKPKRENADTQHKMAIS
jgi:hypothetical protein